jgi:predicted nucleic-acid-binding protein
MSGAIKISRDALANIVKSIISSSRMVIDRQTLNAGASTTLFNNTVFFAVVLIHGDGDPEIQLTVTVGNDTTTVAGNEIAIAVATNELLKIDATNIDRANPHSTPTIEVILIKVG